ncbi:MAG TPA: DUF4922 domain-containing protein [Prolixibacteraceae bacterium]|nr:DUF4922 domain-containing protein [Prolixibacteraceae bacterium]
MTNVSISDLRKYGKTYNLSVLSVALVNHQKANWKLASSNYRSLKQIRKTSFDFDHFRIDCQFNPERIRSSAADTGIQSIQARPCFLCNENRPEEQNGIPYGDEFIILCNPYPIFPYHLTIPTLKHIPQLIEDHIQDFLHLTKDLQDFTVFYNGPECGASAPDHFHFQAGIRDFLPIEDELPSLLADKSERIFFRPEVEVYAIHDYLRKMLILKSDEEKILADTLKKVIRLLEPSQSGPEPMLNLLGYFKSGVWHIVLIPRRTGRPSEYYADEFEKILVSPAAVEMAGLLILPREEDFFKISKENIHSIYHQVSIGNDEFHTLTEQIKTLT